MAINNSNTAGVTGAAPFTLPTTDTDGGLRPAGNPQDVLTGIEFSIPLSEIGYTSGPIKLFAFVNGGGHDYASNQFSGAGILDGNLGGNGFGGFTGDLSGVLMTDFAGDQFVTIPAAATTAASAVPEPGSVLLAGIALVAGLGILRRR